MKKSKGMPNRPQNQVQSSPMSELQKNSILLLEQALITNLHINKSYYGKYDFVTLADVTKCEKELADFYKREDVKSLMTQNLPPISKLSRPPRATPDKKKTTRKKTIHLICINEGSLVTAEGEIVYPECPINFLDRYTSPGKEKDKYDQWVYPINELYGYYYLADRFMVSKAPSKKR